MQVKFDDILSTSVTPKRYEDMLYCQDLVGLFDLTDTVCCGSCHWENEEDDRSLPMIGDSTECCCRLKDQMIKDGYVFDEILEFEELILWLLKEAVVNGTE